MKKILLLLILAITGLGVNAQCDYTVSLYDSFGDGWDGSETAPAIPDLEIIVNGSVLTTVTMTSPTNGPQNFLFSVNPGDLITTNYEENGAAWGVENGYVILDNLGAVVGSSGMQPGNTAADGGVTPGDITTAIVASCPTPCAGTPAPGLTTSTNSPVCPGVDFTLGITNDPNESGYSYQWQTSLDDITYTNASSTSPTFTTNQAVATYYQCVVTCANSGLSGTSTPILVGMEAPANCYCIPTYTTGKTAGDLIASVEIVGTTLNNVTGTAPTNPAYTFFSAVDTPDLTAGSSYTVNVSVGSFGGQNMAAWIDFNDDGIFDPSERIGFTTGPIGAFGTASFTISLGCSPPPGIHRLRIRDVWNTAGNLIDPCLVYGWGETEDYLVNVLPPPPCPSVIGLAVSNVTGTTATIAWDTGCIETIWDVDLSTSPTPAAFPSIDDLAQDSLNATGLTPNTTYYAHVRADCEASGQVGNGQSAYITVSFTTTPTNNDCGTAETLVQGASCSYTAGNNAGATPSGAFLASCAPFGADQDVWYKFDAVNGTIIFNLDLLGATNMGLAIYDTCFGAELFCLNGFPDSTDFTLAGFTPGEEYFVRLFSSAADAGSFDFCISTPPPCAPPFALAATNISTDSADLSWAEAGTATSWDIYLGVVPFDTTGIPPTFTGVSNPFTASGLTPDTDYEFYVSGAACDSFTGPFAFSTLPIPPANDTCGGAIGLTVYASGASAGFETAASTLAASHSPMGTTSCDGSLPPGNLDLFYTFTMPAGETAVQLLGAGPTANDIEAALYTACGTVDIQCQGNSATHTFSGLTPGVTYILQVWHDDFNAGDFTIALELLPPPPVNDTCGSAIGLTVYANGASAGFETAASTLAASHSPMGTTTCDGSLPPGNLDLFYTFTMPAGETAVQLLGAGPTANNIEAALYTACGTVDIQCQGNSATHTFTGLTPGATYILQVWHDDFNAGDFTIALELPPPPPVNDDCANAIPVFGGYSITGFSTTGATVEAVDPTSCTFNDVAAVWFEYTAPCNTTVEVNTCGSTYDTNISIWDDCNYTTELACNDDAGALGPCTFTLQSFVSFAATSGTTYYIRISGFAGSTGDINFELIETTPCPCTQNVWTNGNGTGDWSDGLNWTCGVAPTNDCASGLGSDIAIVPAGSATPPVVTGTQGAASLTIGAGSSIAIDGTLQVCGNVSHDGNSLTGAGDLELNGSAAQMLSGTGAFGTVELVNAAGANVMASAALSVDSALILTSGTFTNNGSFSLNSGLSGTAYLDDFTGSGSYVGDLTVNRFVTDGFAGGLGQRYFGSAVAGSTVSGLDNTYTVYPVNGYIMPVPTCDPDSIMPASPYSNLLEWREDAPFSIACVQEGWWALPTASTNLTPGRGYSGWMSNGSTVSVTGAPNTGVQSYATTNSVTNTTSAQGYHVLSNPYPSPMNVNAVTLGSGLSSPQYYNSASGAWSGTFQPVLVAGAEIPIMQGFTAYSSGAGAFTPDDSYRIAATNDNFAKSTSWYDFRLDVEISIAGMGDITYLYYSGSSTDQFDIAGDCWKRESDAGRPTLYTRNNGEMMSLNGLNLNDLGMSVPMGLIAPEATTASFSFSGMDDFPANTIIYLEDKVEGIFHNLNDGPYSFEADPAENGSDRFEIHFSLPASFNLIEPSCENPNAIIVENTNDGRVMTISNAGVLEETTVLDGSENVLPAGDYEIEVFDVFGASQIYVFVIEEVDVVDAAVMASSTDIETGESVNFDYLGSGALNFEWRINGQLMAQTELFNYQFNTPGEYVVELIASNDICDAHAVETITVSEKSTSIVNVGGAGTLNIYADKESNIVLQFSNVNQGFVSASVYNLLGQEIAKASVDSNGKQTIPNKQWAQGYYIVKVQIGTEVVNQTILISK